MLLNLTTEQITSTFVKVFKADRIFRIKFLSFLRTKNITIETSLDIPISLSGLNSQDIEKIFSFI
jgi:hypothetical protein